MAASLLPLDVVAGAVSQSSRAARMERPNRRPMEPSSVLPILSLLLSPIGGVVVWLIVCAGKHGAEYLRETKRLRQQLQPAGHKASESAANLELLTARLKQSEALIAERDATIAALRARLGAALAGNVAFHRLRAVILHELHPDHAPQGSVERTLRQEVFKRLWPQVEELSRARNRQP
jgi:hypothetical protein